MNWVEGELWEYIYIYSMCSGKGWELNWVEGELWE